MQLLGASLSATLPKEFPWVYSKVLWPYTRSPISSIMEKIDRFHYIALWIGFWNLLEPLLSYLRAVALHHFSSFEYVVTPLVFLRRHASPAWAGPDGLPSACPMIWNRKSMTALILCLQGTFRISPFG